MIHSALGVHLRSLREGLTVTPQAVLGVYHDAWRRERDKAGEKIPVKYNVGEDEEKRPITRPSA